MTYDVYKNLGIVDTRDLPEYLRSAWGNDSRDPRTMPRFCPKQSHKTPSIPWHNSSPCLSCGALDQPTKRDTMYRILRDGVEVATANSETELLRYFHHQHSYSMAHGLTYEGYSIEDRVGKDLSADFGKGYDK